MNRMDKRKIKALMKARLLIEREDEDYICYALAMVASTNPKLADAKDALTDYILDQLSPFSFLGPWQQKTFGIPGTYIQQRKDRLAWIDWMIEQLKKD